MSGVDLDLDVDAFRTFGFVVLPQAIDPAPLADEVDRALADGARAGFRSSAGGGISGRYVPMMCDRTPVSLGWLDRFAGPAAELLGRAVLPVRAKGTEYSAGTGWHRDSDRDWPSVGFAAYLQPLDAATGALRVLPGSHRSGFGASVAGHLDRHRAVPADEEVAGLPAFPLETAPGDVIVFDEHLFHASAGGRDRRQWRVDFTADPVGAEETTARAYFSAVFPPRWEGAYDVDRYPSYGRHWQSRPQPWVARLAELGVYTMAAAGESLHRPTGRP